MTRQRVCREFSASATAKTTKEFAETLKIEDFDVPALIDGKEIRKDGDKFYDQIAVRVKDPRFKVVTGGIVELFADVSRDNATDRQIYQDLVPKEDPENNPKYKAKSSSARYRKWWTWQLSDHKPLWIEIETDFSDHYLGEIAGKN